MKTKEVPVKRGFRIEHYRACSTASSAGAAAAETIAGNQSRWFDPAVGRWLSEDPTGFAAGDDNLYRYVHDAPTNGADPRGLAGYIIIQPPPPPTVPSGDVTVQAVATAASPEGGPIIQTTIDVTGKPSFGPATVLPPPVDPKAESARVVVEQSQIVTGEWKEYGMPVVVHSHEKVGNDLICTKTTIQNYQRTVAYRDVSVVIIVTGTPIPPKDKLTEIGRLVAGKIPFVKNLKTFYDALKLMEEDKVKPTLQVEIVGDDEVDFHARIETEPRSSVEQTVIYTGPDDPIVIPPP